MPVDIVSTGGSPYQVVVGESAVSEHREEHKALERAVNESLSCGCLVFVRRNEEYRVTYVPAQAVVRVSWAPPENVDGITGYRIRHITVNGESIIDVDNVTVFRLPVDPGFHQFYVATKASGLVSEWGGPAEVNVQ